MKKRLPLPVIIILVILAPVIISAVLFGSMAFLMCSHINSIPSPPPPQITRAEFPFTLVYELHGEEVILEDTLICEYAGDEWSDGFGKKFRAWEESYASGVEDIILGHKSTDEYEEYIVFSDGYNSAFLMGDTEHYRYGRGTGFGVTRRKCFRSFTSLSAITDDELYSVYGIKLISFEMHEPPIENSFDAAE